MQAGEGGLGCCRAEALGTILEAADRSASGLPYGAISMSSHLPQISADSTAQLAELGTQQVALLPPPSDCLCRKPFGMKAHDGLAEKVLQVCLKTVCPADGVHHTEQRDWQVTPSVLEAT